METLKDLQNKRTALGQKAQAIVAAAMQESRSMTEAEDADFKATTRQYDQLNQKIASMTAQIITPDLGGSRSTEASNEVRALDDKETAVSFLRNRGVQDSGVSFGAYLRAMAIGGKTEQERRALSEGTDSAGGYTVPDILSAEVVDRLRAATTVTKLGARVVPLLSDVHSFARITADATASWKAESASISESAPVQTPFVSQLGRIVSRPERHVARAGNVPAFCLAFHSSANSLGVR